MATTLDESPAISGPGNQTPRWMQLARGSIVGLTLAVLLVLARQYGLLHGKVMFGAFALAVLAIPTSRQLSRRVLLGICLAFGWIPLLWWWPLPVGDLGRGTLLLALMVGGLGGWVGAGRRPWLRCARLVPRIALIDTFPFVLAAFSALVLHPWLRAKSGTAALSLLMGGWDHAAHFSMVRMIRQGGVTVDMATSPESGGAWQFSDYPQSFHAVTATIVELLTGPRVSDLATELNVFCQAIAIVTVCLVAMLVAGICALPVLRRRPAIALPLATFVTAVFIFGPGSIAINEGFVNFSFACALVAGIALLVVPMARVLSPLHLAATGGAVVGIANGWILLLVLAVPAALIGLCPLSRNRLSTSRGRALVSGAIIAIVFACVARAAVVVSHAPVDNVLLLQGGITPPNIGLALVAVFGCLASCIVVGMRFSRLSRRRTSGPIVRVRLLVVLPLVGMLGAVWFAAWQLSQGPILTYYFMKYTTGVEIILLVVMMIPLAYIVTRWMPQQRSFENRNSAVRKRVGRVASASVCSLALAVSATQVFGFAAPDLTAIKLPPTALGALNRVSQNARIADPFTESNLVEKAPRLNQQYSGHTVFFFSFPSDRRVHPMNVAQWYFSLTSTWKGTNNEVAGNIDFLDYTVEAVASSASRILNDRPDAYVAVGADWVDAIRRLLSPTVPADHVVAW